MNYFDPPIIRGVDSFLNRGGAGSTVRGKICPPLVRIGRPTSCYTFAYNIQRLKNADVKEERRNIVHCKCLQGECKDGGIFIKTVLPCKHLQHVRCKVFKNIF